MFIGTVELFILKNSRKNVDIKTNKTYFKIF